MAAQPAFPERQVERVKREIVTEILSDLEDPRTVASLRFRKEVYGAHPYSRPARGTQRHVLRARRRDLGRFHARWFRTQGACFAAAGPEPVEATLDLLERAARPLPRGELAHRPLPAPSLPSARRDLHLPMAREQVHVFVGHAGVRRTHPDYYALLVMDHILGTGPGFTSRISKRLRDEQGLCYSVHAAITSSAGEEPGSFTAYIGTSPEHRSRAVEGFLAEMRRIRDTLPGPEELADVQEYLTGSFVFSLERNSNLVRYAIRCKRFGLGLDYLHRYPLLIRGVTAEEVKRVANAHLHPDRVVVVSAGAGNGKE
jgi:zinc protease